jgi:hypothetical protein
MGSDDLYTYCFRPGSRPGRCGVSLYAMAGGIRDALMR